MDDSENVAVQEPVPDARAEWEDSDFRRFIVEQKKCPEIDLLGREVLCYLRLAALAKHDDAREVYIEDAMALMKRIVEEIDHDDNV